MVIMAFLCLFFCLMMVVVTGRGGGIQTNPQIQRTERQIKSKKDACERSVCTKFIRDEGMNCVNECMSKMCYDEVYAKEPLEDGEIDTFRNRLFTQCMHKEIKEEMNRNVADNRGKKWNRKGTETSV
jgi:hypothetical protein